MTFALVGMCGVMYNKSMDEPIQTEEIRNPDGTFKVGNPGGPGRPKGESLKEYWKRKFYAMTDEEKEEFSKKVGFEMIWKMGEGMPKQDTDHKVQGEMIIMFDEAFKNKDETAPSAKEDSRE